MARDDRVQGAPEPRWLQEEIPNMKTNTLCVSDRVLLHLLDVTVMSGCGLFKVREKNDLEVAKIHKVAVVAFSAVEPAPNAISLNLNKGRTETVAGGSMLTQHSEHIDEMVAGLREELAKNLHWQV